MWEYDFERMAFAELQLEGPDRDKISRSNHTAVYYESHDA